MKSHSKFFRIFFTIVIGLILAACGGGGSGDSGGISYTGSTDQASIDGTNAVEIATTAYKGVNAGSALGNIASLNAEEAGGLEGSMPLTLARILDETLRRIDITSASSKAVYTATDTVYGDCPGSPGSASVSITYDDVTGEFSGSVTFNDYCTGGVTVSGATSFSGTLNTDTGELISFSFTFDSLTATSGTESLTMDGQISFTVGSSSVTMSMDMLLRNNTTGEIFWLDNYNMVVYDYSGYYTVDITSGRYYLPNHGYVDFYTSEPLYYSYGAEWPYDGVIIYEGSNGTKARLTVLSSTTFQVEADTDNDGLYDDYNSGVLYWADI